MSIDLGRVGFVTMETEHGPVTIAGPDRWERLLELEYEPAFIEQMAHLNHYERLPHLLDDIRDIADGPEVPVRGQSTEQ